MRYLLALILLLLAPLALAIDLEARQGNDWVRLTEAPCVSELVLGRIPEQRRDEFHAATAQFQGQMHVACWRKMDNVVFLIYEDGDQGVIPMQEIKPVPEA